MRATARPRFRALERAETDALLARNHVGRIAYGRGDRIAVQEATGREAFVPETPAGTEDGP